MAGSWGQQLIGSGTTGGSATGLQYDCPGGLCVYAVVGTFGGATVGLFLLGPDGATFIAAGTNTNLTAAGAALVYLPPCVIQAQVAGGAPSGIFASIARVTD